MDAYTTCENGIWHIQQTEGWTPVPVPTELSSKTFHQKYSLQPSSPNQMHLLQWTHYHKMSWGTEMSSEKEGLQQC